MRGICRIVAFRDDPPDAPRASPGRPYPLICVPPPEIRERFAEQIASLPADGALSPEAIGQAFVDLHHPRRSAWSFEIDLRPWAEKF
ncbi:MAG: hypothetical protein IH926_00095 [Proteobacteria bacterium]|nr:hypothetical protein [Pseudomonadota bacterium]